jgi:hypothetical protein
VQEVLAGKARDTEPQVRNLATGLLPVHLDGKAVTQRLKGFFPRKKTRPLSGAALCLRKSQVEIAQSWGKIDPFSAFNLDIRPYCDRSAKQGQPGHPTCSDPYSSLLFWPCAVVASLHSAVARRNNATSRERRMERACGLVRLITSAE